MELAFAAVDGNFVESLLKGFRSTFLSDGEYGALKECASIDDMVAVFQETDYGDFLKDPENPGAPVDPATIKPKCREKAAREFAFLRAQASEPLSTFMDYVTHEHMITLVLELLKLVSRRADMPEEDYAERVDKLLHVSSHPLGRLDDSTAQAILAFGSNDEDVAELYHTVLIDTPVGKYFARYLAEESELRGAGQVQAAIAETPTARLEGSVMKAWLEDFYFFCMEQGGETAEVMSSVLGARAAALTINITYNSMRTEFNQPAQREEFRMACFPSFGPLYPEGCARLAKAGSADQLRGALLPFESFGRLWDRAKRDADGNVAIHDEFFKKDVFLLQRAFEGQNHMAMFYAYVQLKEQEAKNLSWIASGVDTGNRDFARVIHIFSRDSGIGPWSTGECEEPAM